MPRRAKRRRSSRRFVRRVRRRVSRGRFRRRRRIGLLWPNSKLVKLRYVDVDTPFITLSAATNGGRKFKLNSAFDVNDAGASTAMPGFGEYSTMYKIYRVAAAKITTIATVEGTTVNVPLTIGIHMSGSNITTTDWSEWMRALGGNKHSTSTQISLYEHRKISLYRRMSTIVGNARNYWGNDAFGAVVGSDPASLIYGFLRICTTDGAATSLTVALKTTVTLYIRFSNVDTELD